MTEQARLREPLPLIRDDEIDNMLEQIFTESLDVDDARALCAQAKLANRPATEQGELVEAASDLLNSWNWAELQSGLVSQDRGEMNDQIERLKAALADRQ